MYRELQSTKFILKFLQILDEILMFMHYIRDIRKAGYTSKYTRGQSFQISTSIIGRKLLPTYLWHTYCLLGVYLVW